MSAKRSKKKHPGVESWMWQLFHKGPFYKDNKTYREARCRAEVKLAQDKLKTEQEEKIRHGVLPSEKALADAELHTLALKAVIPFCGKPEKLRSHIRTCDHVEQKWKLRLEKEKESDDSDNDTSTPTVPSGTSTSAVTLPQKRKQATFSVISEPRLPVFKKQKQKQFESDILKFWTVLNASYNSIEIPFVTKFFNDCVPGAELPGRVLFLVASWTRRSKISRPTSRRRSGRVWTASVDGWSTKHDAIQQTSFNVKGQEYALNVHVTTNERKTSANLLTHVLADLQMLAAWGAFIINLVVKDYIKNPVIVQILSSCLIVINWFSSHKRALFMLLEQQQKANEARPPGEHWERLKCFVRAAITRWGTHALSTRRLLDLKKFLVDLVNHRSEDLRLAGGSDEDSITAATAVIKLIDSGSHGTFWSGVERPANITQGANTRLDHVVITLAMLHRLYSTSSSFEYPADNQAIWGASKNDFYILAVFLNPFLRGFYFGKSIHSLGRTGLFAVVKRVYRRMHNIPEVTPLPSQLFADYLNYYDGKGNYTADAMNLDEFKDLFENKDTIVFMNSIWRGIQNDFAQKFALRVLSIVANSGANERGFSVMGRTYSDKARNLLDPQRAHKNHVVRRHISQAHPVSKRKGRHMLQYSELRADVASGTNNTIHNEGDGSDEELDGDLGKNDVQHLSRALDKIPEDGDALDAAVREEEVEKTFNMPQIRIHFGTTELYELGNIFAPNVIEKKSPWGGYLRSYELNGKEGMDSMLAEFEEDPVAANKGTGSANDPQIVKD
ncbi:hypothetical protein B0H10DRAFT_2438834 [Mycena sp. CBHHK59/15]|nr:hypothetical protein B0H10DRAFT_2438834 [Mycena sp. CBHHK59/15]